MENKKFNIVTYLENSTLPNDIIENGFGSENLFLPKDITIRYCRIEDICNDENYYLIIRHTDEIRDNFSLSKGFPTDIKNAISNNNLKILFISLHESLPNLEIFVVKLMDIIKTNNWKESNFYIINNNSLLYKIKTKFNSNINFWKMNYLLRLVSTDKKPKIFENDNCFNKKFIFLCLNRNPNYHRISLLIYLKNLKLLENDIIDWSWVNPYKNKFKNFESINYIKKYFNAVDEKVMKTYSEIFNQKKLSFYEQNSNIFNDGAFWTPNKHTTLDSYKNSYINIVTETYFDFFKYNIHITEKSFKPFYYFQLPIFLAQHNHIKTMREEYDFYFFDDLIDHSYDNEIDYIKRFQMVVNEIKRLSTMKEEISEFYKNNIDRLIHNHNFIKTYPEKKIEENYFLNLIDKKL